MIDGDEDDDGDHLTDAQEFKLKLNPKDDDSDNDGIKDYMEDEDHNGIHNQDDGQYEEESED